MAGDDDVGGRAIGGILAERRVREAPGSTMQRAAERAAREAVGKRGYAMRVIRRHSYTEGTTETAANPPYAGVSRIRFSGSWAAAHLSAAHERPPGERGA